ncbi:MAG: hypothetical protein AB7P49_20380, partial [Bdellovibrionales bacterium]
MAGPKIRVMPDILEEHFEELDFLWGQRRAGLRSPDFYNYRSFLELEGRIEAHVQGLLLGKDQTVALVEPGLAVEDGQVAFAAAYTLLRLNRVELAEKVFEAWQQAEGNAFQGIEEALCQSPLENLQEKMQALIPSENRFLSSAAAEVLVFHSLLSPSQMPLLQYLNDGKPEVRRAGWQIVSQVPQQAARDFSSGWADSDPEVRRQALEAAAWNGHNPLLAHCRQCASKPDPEHLLELSIFAILAKPEDLPLLQQMGKTSSLGPERYSLLGCYGHPATLEFLLAEMASDNPENASASGQAFMKIIGVDIESDRRVPVAPEGDGEPDEFEMEFLDEVTLPDVEKAKAIWTKLKDNLSKGTRWCGGLDLSHGAEDKILHQLDLASRWEACLRGKYQGTWPGKPQDLLKFPQL